jgi:hypothetical protein
VPKKRLGLEMAKNILTLHKDTPIYDAARHLLDSIIAPLTAEGNSDWYESRIVVPQVPTALRENRILTFEYQGVYDEGYKPRRVRPYQLLFDTGLRTANGLMIKKSPKPKTALLSLLPAPNLTRLRSECCRGAVPPARWSRNCWSMSGNGTLKK